VRLNFSKKIVLNYPIDGFKTVNQGSLYQVFDGEKLEGQFLFSRKASYIKYKEEKLFIRKRKIISEESPLIIGYYKLTNWIAIIGYRDKLIWDDKEYLFKRIKPDISYSLFKKDTWGHFKFQLTSYEENVIYSFRINMPVFSIGNPVVENPFQGEIELNNTNILIAFAGLYLLERSLDNQSID
jgi:hypothetical protein